MKNVSIWYQENLNVHSSTKHLLSNSGNSELSTYWSCIVQIGIFINLASNMFLLASKNCSLTSQG